jgi:hypothetical protein
VVAAEPEAVRRIGRVINRQNPAGGSLMSGDDLIIDKNNLVIARRARCCFCARRLFCCASRAFFRARQLPF